jgi:CheY-like chemotaxis protein
VARTFGHVAEAKNLAFQVRFVPELPRSIFTDAKRLQQVLKNLLANAFKFTHQGFVSLTAEPVRSGWSTDNERLNRAASVLAFSVADTGIGIAADKQQIIFEAFQQAEGGTSRKYGGTGLGLAISRELSRLLGGEIRLVSNPGQGSTFTLYLPHIYAPPRAPRKPGPATAEPLAPLAAPTVLAEARLNGNGHFEPRAALVEAVSSARDMPVAEVTDEVGDDRDDIQPGDSVLVIVENDLGFARVLLDAAREKGFKGLVTSLGAAALALVREYHPDAVTLDILLPDMEGWRVLDRLKNDLAIRHIPVCVISTEEARARALQSGAVAFEAKPLQTREDVDRLLDMLKTFSTGTRKAVLVAAPEHSRCEALRQSIGLDDVEFFMACRSADVLQVLSERPIDCLVLDPSLPGLTPAELATALKGDPVAWQVPTLVYQPAEDVEVGDGWRQLPHGWIVRRARSPERLLDHVTFFLHRPIAKLPPVQRELLEGLHRSDQVLPGTRVLIVDDDMRNIFALSTVLEEQSMEIVSANNGRDAIRRLQTDPDIDVVLMDIMMPEMDGIDTMREIRKIPSLKAVPIIAVTAKAMKGDREKCIEAGAWDYLSKPVDTQQLLAVPRAWLHR